MSPFKRAARRLTVLFKWFLSAGTRDKQQSHRGNQLMISPPVTCLVLLVTVDA